MDIGYKSKKIIFRIQPEMFDFINKFAKAVRIERSELMRRIVEHYFLIYFSNNNTDYNELKKRFLEMEKTTS